MDTGLVNVSIVFHRADIPQSRMKPNSIVVCSGKKLTTAELMSLLKVRHKQTIYKLIKEGLPHSMTNGGYYFDPLRVIAHLRTTSGNRLKSR